MEELESPWFEEVNPYLIGTEEAEEAVDRAEETVDRAEEAETNAREALRSRKEHFQAKLKENIKREDELNRLMQLKIEECRSAVPKHFDQILQFFRGKINVAVPNADGEGIHRRRRTRSGALFGGAAFGGRTEVPKHIQNYAL
jgi:flavin-binding protein dodecin